MTCQREGGEGKEGTLVRGAKVHFSCVKVRLGLSQAESPSRLSLINVRISAKHTHAHCKRPIAKLGISIARYRLT